METTDTTQNRHLVRREMTELQNRNYDIVDELYADNVQIGMRRTGSPEQVASRDDLKTLYREWGDAFPDMTVDIEAEVAEGDTVIQQVTIRGTHEATFRGVEGTGEVIEITGFHKRRIADGKIVEATSLVSMSTLFDQLGLGLPLPS